MSEILLVAATERELPALDGIRRLCCGIGPVESALGTAQALSELPCDLVLHVGIAGAAMLPPGSIVIGSESTYCDVLDPNATLPRVSRVSASPELVSTVRQILPEAVVLPIATAARVGGGTGHEVEAMEGFGVLRAAELAGVPGLELRVISNATAEANRSLWRIDDAITVLHRALERVIPALR